MKMKMIMFGVTIFVCAISFSMRNNSASEYMHEYEQLPIPTEHQLAAMYTNILNIVPAAARQGVIHEAHQITLRTNIIHLDNERLINIAHDAAGNPSERLAAVIVLQHKARLHHHHVQE